ncbi:endonuclease [uncultured Algibacter sp.]|uniref:endonuclease n=1 Tax=uncultured Algibacter sp. TaxID=298659 RepID=UPI0026068F29|nr:endonuclease [uncultured Algibacter sp.]
MKQQYILFLLITSIGFAQIPSGYYNDANGKTGSNLKTALHLIIDEVNDLNNQAFHDTSVTYGDLWTLYQTSDIRNDGKVWDMYSNCNFTFGTNQDTGGSVSGECEKYNREHTFPKSWFGDINNHPMQADAFHIIPSDKSVNALRANYAYGEVSTPSSTTGNGSKLGTSSISGPTALVFEPIDIYKGDIARGLFYVAVRYQDEIASWELNNSNGNSMLDGSSFKVFEQWALDMLYDWHINDPVSDKERDRNEEIFKHQNNRNPFIDSPEYVLSIWGNLLSTQNHSISSIKMHPNPVQDNFLYFSATQNLEVIIYNVIGKQVLVKNIDKKNNSVDISNLSNGIYVVKLTSKQGSSLKKLIKQ